MSQLELVAIPEGIPPISNTGVTTPSAIPCFLDYLSFTVPESVDQNWLRCFLAGTSDWEENPHGIQGYWHSADYGEIRIAWGGNSGIHVRLRGQGCRQIEQSPKHDWKEFLKGLVGVGAKFTRADWAWDCRRNEIDLAEIERKIRSGCVSTKAQRFGFHEETSKRSQTSEGKTIYVGRAASERRVRFYDKAAEQNEEGYWVRVELVTKDRWANKSVDEYIQGGCKAVSAILAAYVTFHEYSDDGHVHRRPAAGWWSEFLSKVEKSKAVVQSFTPTMEKVVDWLCKSVAPSLALALLEFGGDLQGIIHIINHGRRNFTSKHLNILKGRVAPSLWEDLNSQLGKRRNLDAGSMSRVDNRRCFVH